MQDFKLLTRQLLETYLGSDTLSDVAIQDFLDSNASIIGTGKQEFFKNIEHFLNSFKFDVEKRKNIHFEFKDLEIEENIVDDQCVFVYGSVKIYGLYDKEVTIIHLDSRFTIIYGVRDGKWKVLHIHHSIPDKEQLEDEEFPITLGKQVQQARHEVEALSAGYSYICLINLETGDVELIKGNNIPGLNGRYTQMDHNILLEQVNRLIAKPFRKSSFEFYDSKTIAKRLEGKNSLFHTCERTDGTWILSMIVPQKYDENGRVVSVLLANRDFTEEKKRELEQEEALRQEKIKAEKANEAKSIFLFNMSHDIRTPMNAIVGYSQLMKKECKRQIEPILKERSLCEIIEPQGGRIFMPGTSKVDWMHMFEEQESSNLSISQYCKLHGISDKAFYNARSRYKKTVETPSLVAVEVNDDIGSSNTGCISFKLNGMSFEFDESAPDNDIQRIIKICLAL